MSCPENATQFIVIQSSISAEQEVFEIIWSEIQNYYFLYVILRRFVPLLSSENQTSDEMQWALQAALPTRQSASRPGYNPTALRPALWPGHNPRIDDLSRHLCKSRVLVYDSSPEYKYIIYEDSVLQLMNMIPF